jgi:DNA polymerase-1
MPKTLYIIDGHAHIFAAYFAPMRQQLSSPSGEPTKATYIFTTAVLGLIERHKPDMLVVAMDTEAPTFRHEMFPEYKAHRPPPPEDLPVQVERIVQILEGLRIPILRRDGFEADDVIATLARQAAADGHDVFICSKDKDILQAVDERVRTFDMKTGKITDAGTMREEMGIGPEQIVDCLALEGDSVDNVPGVPLIGPKTARELIRTYGDLDGLYAHAEEIKGKRGENLRDSKAQAYLSRDLVTLNDEVPIEVDYDAFTVHEPDRDALTPLFQQLGFNRLLTQLGLTGASNPGPPTAAEPPPAPAVGPASARTVDHRYELIDTSGKFEPFLAQLCRQTRLAIDTETTAVDPMRADLVGISFCWEAHRAFYLPVRGPLGATHLDLGVVREKLGPILGDETVQKIGQNIKYDLHVLRNAGMPLKGVYFDTMVASYCLDPGRSSNAMDAMALDYLNYECIPIATLIGKGKNQLTFDMVDTAVAVEYAAEDADVTWQLYQYLSQRLAAAPSLEKLFRDVEMPLVAVLAEMERHGVSIDTALLKTMSGELEETLGDLAEKIFEQAGTVFNIDSPKQLAEVLFDRLGLKSSRVGKAGRSTDAGVLEQLADQHPIANLVLEHRTLSKLKNTYCDKLGAMINPRTGRLHASFNQTVTATGRLSSSDPNLQNIPIRTELGRRIRAAFVPQDADDCILSLDYSQIELRLLAHFSGDEALREAFAADQDIHRFVASQIYGVPVDDVTSDMRAKSKAVNFGIIYGQGAFGLARSVGISPNEARQFIEDYFRRYGSIRAFLDECIAKARQTGYAETILGRRRAILNLRSRNAGRRAQAERLAVNTVIQGSAADLIKLAMLNIHRRLQTKPLPIKMILQVHDELVFELPSAQVKQHVEWIADDMVGALPLSVPLKVDVSVGPSWLTDN